jgi:hypothetical protein
MKRIALVLVAAAVVTFGIRLAFSRGEPTSTGPKPPHEPIVGEAAPAFQALDADGKRVAVGGASSGWTLLTFFRGAGTPW